MERPSNNKKKSPAWKGIMGAAAIFGLGVAADRVGSEIQHEYAMDEAAKQDKEGLRATGTIVSIGQPEETIIIRSDPQEGDSPIEMETAVYVMLNGRPERISLDPAVADTFEVGQSVDIEYSELHGANRSLDFRVDRITPRT